jgi:hypothetical protein
MAALALTLGIYGAMFSVAGASGATARAGGVVDLGARYDGRSSNWSYSATIFVASRLTGKSRFFVGFRQGRCSDGGAYNGFDFSRVRQGFTIKASGGAAFTRRYSRAFFFTRRGKRVWGSERFSVLMQFSGNTVSGVLTDTFRSRHLRCSSGPVSFTAWRDGTPQAPLNTSYASTGRYAGRSSYGDSMAMNVFLPLGVITRLRITFKAGLSCTGGLSVRRPVTFTFTGISITGTSFSFHGHNTVSGGGWHYRQRWSMTGNPIRDPVWSFVVTAWRNGRHYGTCRTRGGGDQFRLKPPHGRPV